MDTGPPAGAAAGLCLQPGQRRGCWERGTHLCGRSGRSSAGFPMEGKKRGQTGRAPPQFCFPRCWVGVRLVCRCFDLHIRRVCRWFVLQHPLLRQRSSRGHALQEMLLNDLSPASPKPVSSCLAKATAPRTEGMAKLGSKGETQQTPLSRRSPAHH